MIYLLIGIILGVSSRIGIRHLDKEFFFHKGFEEGVERATKLVATMEFDIKRRSAFNEIEITLYKKGILNYPSMGND
jgi:hypothetical protein